MRSAKNALKDLRGARQRGIPLGEAPGRHLHRAEIAQRQANLVVVRAEHGLERSQHFLQRLDRLAVAAARLENRRERCAIDSPFEFVRPHAADGRTTR